MDLYPLMLDLKFCPVINMVDQPCNLCKAGAVLLVSAVFYHLVSELDLT